VTHPRPPPFRRAGAGLIEVDLPPWLVDFMVTATDRIRGSLEQPGTPAFGRLNSPIEEAADVDDPLVVLSRQTMLDEVVSAVSASVRSRLITDADAEAWLKLLGLALAARAAELGVRSEEHREALSSDDEGFFGVAHTLQLLLIEVLDTPDV
jgi:hypothetical protein